MPAPALFGKGNLLFVWGDLTTISNKPFNYKAHIEFHASGNLSLSLSLHIYIYIYI